MPVQFPDLYESIPLMYVRRHDVGKWAWVRARADSTDLDWVDVSENVTNWTGYWHIDAKVTVTGHYNFVPYFKFRGESVHASTVPQLGLPEDAGGTKQDIICHLRVSTGASQKFFDAGLHSQHLNDTEQYVPFNVEKSTNFDKETITLANGTQIEIDVNIELKVSAKLGLCYLDFLTVGYGIQLKYLLLAKY